MQPNTWIKSDRSGPNTDNCVEVRWQSAPCDANACVEVGWKVASSTDISCVEVNCNCQNDEILVRDSKDREGPVLRFNRDEWTAFLAGVRDGQFDLK